MRLGRRIVGGIAALLAALPTAAGAADPPKTVSEVVVTATKTVSELVVTAPVKCPRASPSLNFDTPRRPVVVGSFPANGQKVRPGLVVLRMTFDRPVACAGGFSDDPPLADPCPGRSQHMVLSYDRRTVRTVCLLDPDKVYGLRLNQNPMADVFRTADGAVGQAFDLRFSTTLEAAVTDVCEALRQDVEMVAQVERFHPLGCAPRDDPQVASVKAAVELRDTAARAAREQAIAEAQALREKQAAADLARAQQLAQAAYRKARDRNWAAARRTAGSRKPDPDDDRLVVAPTISLRAPEPGVLNVLPDEAAALTRRRAERTQPPELPNWRQAFVVGAASYDCGVKDGAVTCARR